MPLIENKSKRNISMDYFRAFLMLLVVWHHATLAYSVTGSGVLISDPDTFVGFDLIALYNDFFFMFAFFFISGFFSYKALKKKGLVVYLEERLIRLLLPFSFGTLLINPVAHYFSFLKKESLAFSTGGYFHFLFKNFGKTEANHLWFLWVLFLFSLILVLYAQCRKAFNAKIKIEFNQEKYLSREYRFTAVMIIGALLLYLPLRNIAAGGFMTLIKPFNMQVSRILLYFLYFIAGNVTGTYGIEKSFFFQDRFRKKWWLWIILSFVFAVLNLVIHVMRETMNSGMSKDIVFIIEQGMVVVISLFALYGFLSFFTMRVKGNNPVMNVLAKEAMGIYVVHYAVVTVLQYVFTFINMSAVLKGVVVAVMALLISLGSVVVLKQIPVIGTIFGKSYDSKYRKGFIALTLVMLLILIFL